MITLENITDIISKSKDNKNYPLEYLSKLYNVKDINDIICTKPLTAINCYIPISTKLDITSYYVDQHKIIKNNDTYKFMGTPGNRIIFSDNMLPFIQDTKHPIPFSFPVIQNNKLELLLSNIYYFELTITDTKNLNYNWATECISIGFASKNTPIKSHIGWYGNSIGYHSDDGTFRYNNLKEATVISRKWDVGDTVGTGVIYMGPNMIKPFYTLNGKLVFLFPDTIQINVPYYPAIGYDHPNSIGINFSTKEFKFDIKKMINENTQYVISTDNKISKNINNNKNMDLSGCICSNNNNASAAPHNNHVGFYNQNGVYIVICNQSNNTNSYIIYSELSDNNNINIHPNIGLTGYNNINNNNNINIHSILGLTGYNNINNNIHPNIGLTGYNNINNINIPELEDISGNPQYNYE